MTNKSSTQKICLGIFAAALVIFLANAVSASLTITSVQVNDIEWVSGQNIAVFAGQNIPVRVIFDVTGNKTIKDARIKVWLSGSREYAVSTPRFDALPGNRYSKLLYIQLPQTLTNKEESYNLKVAVESPDLTADAEKTISLLIERESYLVDVLDVIMPNKITPGATLPINIILKNRGRHLAEDTFVKLSIPALNIADKVYFGDLAPVDQSNPDKEDSLERRLMVKIPSTAPTGTYIVEVEAYNADALTTLTRRLAIVGPADETQVISNVQSKTFSPKQSGEYIITLVNTGSSVRVYELVVESIQGLSVNVNQPIIAVPAGMSEILKVTVNANAVDTYNFALNVHSSGELVKRIPLTANVVKNSTAGGITGNATILLTVVLAIIFIVLLIVLIVLLTKKPAQGEFGESYY